MSGVRYEGWRHTHVAGDRSAGEPYLSVASKLLGYVFEDAKHSNLGVHSVRRELSDGAVVVAEKFGDIPRVTILPPPPGEPRPPLTTPDDFVVFTRAESMPEGLDAEHPQQILRPTWKTFFFDGDVAGYEDFGGEKGTYVGVFPEGVTHAGNIDWRGRGKVRLSWYGPSTRYFYDPFVQPTAQYGRKVFYLGQVLLDMDTYIEESDEDTAFAERYVLGAALRGRSLYVVAADMPFFNTPDPPPEYPNRFGFVTDPAPDFDSNVALFKFTLLVDPAEPVPSQATVAANSREVLWSAVLPKMFQPWFFNESATECVCYGLLAANLWHTTLATEVDPRPSASSPVYTITLDHDAGTAEFVETSTSCAPPPSEAVVAADYIKDEKVELVMVRRFVGDLPPSLDGSREWYLKLDGIEYPLFAPSRLQWLMFADLREKVLLFTHMQFVAGNWQPTGKLHRKGSLVATAPLVFADIDDCRMDSNLGQMRAMGTVGAFDTWAVAPMFPITGMVLANFQIGSGFQHYTIHFAGAHSMYLSPMRRPDDVFGLVKKSIVGSGTDPALLISAFAKPGFNSSAVDLDGNRSVLGCATSEGVTVLSCYKPGAPDESLFLVDESTLPELTGLDGEQARYHPVWLLGKPIP
ncbi:MAG: hypothetical protein ACREO0_04645 [Pseudoxanthomonas sp.]